MAEVFKLYKKVGETPLECVEHFRESRPELLGEKLSYLGRLDPMAEGVLLVSRGAIKRDEILALDKTYEFEALWGFTSDTYDVLGVVSRSGDSASVSERDISMAVDKIKSLKTQKYPPYSSKTIEGKPMWQWAREKRIDEVEASERGIKIFDIKHLHTRWIDKEDLLREVEEKIMLVRGDFRQEEILESWRDVLTSSEKSKFLISKLVADVSSGTYIRSLVEEMGEILEVGALAWSIKRTRVGDYKI